MRIEVRSIEHKREYPTFSRGIRTGAIYFMINANEGVVVKPAAGAPYGSRYRRRWGEDCWDVLPLGTKLEITI